VKDYKNISTILKFQECNYKLINMFRRLFLVSSANDWDLTEISSEERVSLLLQFPSVMETEMLEQGNEISEA